MIHSRVVTDQDTESSSWSSDIWRLWAGLLVVGFLVSILHPTNALLLDHGLWRPISVGSCLISVGLWLRLFLKRSWAQIREGVVRAIPMALIASLLIALLGLGPQGSGSVPLGPKDLLSYVLTLGFWPLNAGPEALLRGFALGLALAIFWFEYRTSHQDLRAAFAGLGSWLAGSLIFILPSLVIWVTLIIGGNSVLSASGAELVQAFSHYNLNTYWSNQQLTRWFTGFGGELSNMTSLFTASWTLVIACLVAVAAQGRRILGLARLRQAPEGLWRAAFILSAPLIGLSAGWGRLPHSGLNLVTWLVLAIVFALFLSLNSRPLASAWQLPAILIVGGLLGWPVLLPLLVALCLLWFIKSQRPSSVSLPWQEFALWFALWSSLAFVGLAFIRGALAYDMGMVKVMLAYGLVIGPALVAGLGSEQERLWLKIAIVWLAAGLISVFLLKSFTVFVLVILAVALGHVWYMVKHRVLPALQYLILVYAGLVFILVFWLPRWLNPQLLPL